MLEDAGSKDNCFEIHNGLACGPGFGKICQPPTRSSFKILLFGCTFAAVAIVGHVQMLIRLGWIFIDV